MQEVHVADINTLKNFEKLFSKYQYISDVYIEGEVTEIFASTFSGCRNIKNIHLSPTVKRIGNHAFQSCKGLHAMPLTNSIEYIGENAFFDLDYFNIEHLYISRDIKYIGKGAFIRPCNQEKCTLSYDGSFIPSNSINLHDWNKKSYKQWSYSRNFF